MKRARALCAIGVVAAIAAFLVLSAPSRSYAADLLFWQKLTTQPNPPSAQQPASVAIGRDVYLLGGGYNVTAVNVYHTATDMWSTATSMTTPVSRTAPALVGSKIYMLGAGFSSGLATNTVYCYDTADGSMSLDGRLPFTLQMSSACELNGKIYLVGGQNGGISSLATDTIYSYDPATHTTSLETHFDPACIPGGRAAAIVFPYSGQLYIFGGYQRMGAFEKAGARYDPSSHTWTKLASLISPASGGKMKACGNGMFYLPNVSSADGAVQEYDMANDSWSLIGKMPTPRSGMAAAVINDGATDWVYAVGGTPFTTPTVLGLNEAGRVVHATASGNRTFSGGSGSATVTVGSDSVGVGFPAGTSGGNVTVSTIAQDQLPPAAAIGFSMSGKIYEISTSATGWPSLSVTLPYDSGLTDAQADQIVVKHWTGGAWVDITPTNVDHVAHTVTFQTASLSPFTLNGPSPSPAPATNTPASSTWSLVALAVLALGVASAALRRRTRLSS